jgi:putative ABC transport system permease protein
MNLIRQFFAILRVNLSGAGQRLGSLLTIVIGVTCAVGVLVSMLAMGTGAREEQLGDARDDRAVLTSVGARMMASSITRDQASTVLGMPGIRKDSDGKPIVTFEVRFPIEAKRRVTGVRFFFPLVGTSGNFRAMSPDLHFTAGRTFKPGLHELIVGNPCVRQFDGFAIGDSRSIRGIDWQIVGQFDQGKTQQCLVLADVDTVMTLFVRNTYNNLVVRLNSPGDLGALRAAVEKDPTLHLEVKSERQAIEDAFKQFNALLNFVGYFVGTIMAIGATLGAVNSLYAIVDSRRRELATLRAIGFSSAAIVASVLCESILLALPGALLGGALAWLFFNGLQASPFGYSFKLAVTLALAVNGIVWALAMGLLGGLLPALRAARVPVTTALRAT